MSPKARRAPAASPRPKVAARPRRRWLRMAARVVEIGVVLVALGGLLLWCSIPNPKRLADENPTSTAFIDLRREEAVAAGKQLQLKWTWKPLGKISRYLRAAVVYAEDANFYKHDGVDWVALEKAVDANLDRGTFAVGGSTITQQLAKNLYLSPSRSLVRKLRELLIAFRLETYLTKYRILELYLNVVEWGDGVFGAEAAARHWFGKSAQALTPAEAVRLACALPNPFTRAPNVRSPELTRKAVRLIRQLRIHGLIDAAQERVALDSVGAKHEKVLGTDRRREDDDDAPPEASTTGSSSTPGARSSTPEPSARGSSTSESSAPSAEPSTDPLPPEEPGQLPPH